MSDSNRRILSREWEVIDRLGMFYSGGNVEMCIGDSHLACWCSEGVTILHISSGKVVQEIKAEEDGVLAFTSHKETLRIATTHKSGLIKVWKLLEVDENGALEKSPRMLKSWKGHELPVSHMCFDPSGILLATGSVDRSARVWNAEHGFATHQFRGHSQMITAMNFHPLKGNMSLFVGCQDGQIKLWNLRTKQSHDLNNHYGAISAFLIISELNILISAARDKVVNLWDIDKKALLKTVPVYDEFQTIVDLGQQNPFLSAENNLNSNQLCRFIAFSGVGGQVSLWKLLPTDNEGRFTLKKDSEYNLGRSDDTVHSVTHLLYLSAKEQLIVVTEDHFIRIMRTRDWKLEKLLVGFMDQIVDVKLFPCGSKAIIVTNSNDFLVLTLDGFDAKPLHGHSDLVLAADISPNGQYIASCSKDNSVRLWRIEEGEWVCAGLGIGHTDSVGCIAFSKSESNLSVFSGSLDLTLKQWKVPNLSSGQMINLDCVKSTVAHQKDINCLAIAPNNSMIATASQDRTIKIWSMDDLSCVGTLSGHKRGIWSICFSDIDRCIASASADKTIKIWSLSSQSCIRTLEGHSSSVLKVKFFNMGMQLLSCGSDATIKLWTVKTNECVNTFSENHTDKIWALDVDGERDLMITGGGDSIVHIWKDVTKREDDNTLAASEEFLKKEQQLLNFLRKSDYSSAIKLALELDQPRRLYGALEKMFNMYESVDSIIQDLSIEDIGKCFSYIQDWNTNSKRSLVAQTLLHAMLRTLTPDRLKQIPGLLGMLDGLIAYSERHFNRANRFLEKSYLIDFMLFSARRLTPLEDSISSKKRRLSENDSEDVVKQEKLKLRCK